MSDSISVHGVMRKFGFETYARQTLAIAETSFATIAKSPTGLVLWGFVAVLLALLMPAISRLTGVPLVPRTAAIVNILAGPIAGNAQSALVLIPLLIVFYAGELVWRERDAGLDEIADATPVPDGILFLGKFLGLVCVLLVWMALLTMAGVFGQMMMGYFDVELGLYLRIFFGLQLLDYLLFALLVFAVHVVVNQKHLGYLVALIAYGVMLFPSFVGLEHHLLIYGSSPRWTYSDLRGFGASLGPWLFFKVYWAGWAALLAVAVRLLWVRGPERTIVSRLHLARRRLTRPVAATAAAVVTLILSTGGFIFYNTNVRHTYVTAADRTARSANYERQYRRYSGIPQPRLTATALRIEIYPERRLAEIRGTYSLVNDSAVAIKSIHLSTSTQVETGSVSFNRQITHVFEDEELRYRIYTFEQPLRPGETMRLTFKVDFDPHGFANDGADASVVANGTCFTSVDWLPAIGYQRSRELKAPGVRREFGLAPRSARPSLDDAEARQIRVGGDPVAFEAIVGTSGDQIAVAPGALRRSWTEGPSVGPGQAGRRYFQYVSDVPIDNRWAVFSARYAVHEETWQGAGQAVAIQIFHHPAHAAIVSRLVAGVRAALDLYTRQLGPYPYGYLRLIESPRVMGVQTAAATIEYGEMFSLLNPGNGPRDVDAVFAVVAHGVARGWWGMQVVPADVEGAGLLEVTLETYSAMRVIEEALGADQLSRYVNSLRRQYGAPLARAAPPLLRAADSLAFSRKGPFALYALHEYIGKDRVDDALRRFFEKYRSGTPPFPTSLDLYRELQAVTPEPFQPLLSDLFEKNTFWDVQTDRATAQQTETGAWRVMLDVRARKVVVDEAGAETEVPMDDWLEVGIAADGNMYLERQRIRSGKQTITVTVSQKPTDAGIDPRHLLSELGEEDRNNTRVKITPALSRNDRR